LRLDKPMVDHSSHFYSKQTDAVQMNCTDIIGNNEMLFK